MQRKFLILAGGLALLAVGLGAFGAHVLEGRLAEDMHQAFETGVRYHLVHALGLGIVALTMSQFGSTRMLAWSARLMCAGIVFFSGSLYMMTLSGNRVFAAATPVGGVAFLLAWGLFIVGVSRK